MSYTIDDLGKQIETYCHDCKEDVVATLVVSGKPNVKEQKKPKLVDNELIVDVTVPVSYQCPICSGLNCGPVKIIIEGVMEDGEFKVVK